MELVPVQSSQIAAVGFDGGSTMQVLFRRGGLYEYADVSVHEYNDVRYAKSVGTAFAQTIKGKKTFRKIEHENGHSNGAPTNSRPASAAHTQREERSAEEPSPTSSAPTDPVLVQVEEVQQVSRKSTELVTQAKAIEVADAPAQERASELLLAVAAMRKEIADTFKPMKDAAFKTHRTICDQERNLDTPLLEAEQTLKRAIGSFVAEQKRLAAEAEAAERRRLQEEADRIAREESERLAIEDALALEADGKIEEAEAVLANPVPVQAVRIAPAPVVPAVAQVKGVRTTQIWKFRITDANKIPREYLVVNESAIKAVVSRTNGKIQIPGVETYPEEQVAASRRG